MPYCVDAMEQNRIILRNVQLALERFIKDSAERGIVENKSTVARRMSALADEPLGDPAKTFRLLMGGKQEWTPKYVKLFADATNTRAEDLYLAAYAGQEMPDDDYPSYFKQWIRRELTIDQMRAIVTMMRRDLNRAGAFELVCQIHDAIVKAPDVRTARDAVDELLRSSSVWTSKPASPDRKKIPS